MILSIIIQCLWNWLNSRLDAYRILKAKHIAHGINFGCYACLVGAQIYYLHLAWWIAAIFCLQAFFNRQITFDIPLNLRRGLKWFYVSLAKPPKAIMDRIEIAVFGYNGRAATISYGVFWVASLITLYFVI